MIPAIGLHPWKVKDAPEDWQAQFLGLIELAGAVGEIGLDQWMDGHDIKQQEAVFCLQLKVAAERNLPVSIHSLKANEVLLTVLRQNALPAGAFTSMLTAARLSRSNSLLKWGRIFHFTQANSKPMLKKRPQPCRQSRRTVC